MLILLIKNKNATKAQRHKGSLTRILNEFALLRALAPLWLNTNAQQESKSFVSLTNTIPYQIKRAMKTPVSLFLPVFILTCFTSCSKVIYVGKTLEPEITLQSYPKEIGFINLFDYTSPAFVKDKNKVSYQAGIYKLAEGLSSFSKTESFGFQIVDMLKNDWQTGSLTELFPVDSISALCKRSNADMLLTLDSMNIFFDWETLVETDDNGGKSKTKNFYLYTGYYLSLYAMSGEMINRSQLQKSLFYKSRPTLSGLITIEPSIAKAKEEVETLSLEAGHEYVAKFFPQDVQVPRELYTGKVFKESNACIMDKNWERAIDILEGLSNSSDPKIAERARKNLSVAREAAEYRDK